MAVGYSPIYSLLNFTNFAHSITVTIGAFCAFFFLSNLVQNLYLGIIIAVLAAGGLAMLIEILGYRPLLKKKARRIYLPDHWPRISTMCENPIIISFSSRFRVYPVNFSNESINLFGASVGQVDPIIFVVNFTALVLVELFIRKSRAGLAIRGAFSTSTPRPHGRERAEANSSGVLNCGILGGLAGALLGAKYTAFPTLGTAMTNKAFISSVFGGLGSIPGAVLGAIILASVRRRSPAIFPRPCAISLHTRCSRSYCLSARPG